MPCHEFLLIMTKKKIFVVVVVGFVISCVSWWCVFLLLVFNCCPLFCSEDHFLMEAWAIISGQKRANDRGAFCHLAFGVTTCWRSQFFSILLRRFSCACGLLNKTNIAGWRQTANTDGIRELGSSDFVTFSLIDHSTFRFRLWKPGSWRRTQFHN